KSTIKKQNSTSPPGSPNQANSWGCAAILGGALTILIALWIIVMLVASWQFLLPLAGIIFGLWLLAKAGNFISGLFSRMLPLLYFGFLGLIGYSMFSAFSDQLTIPEMPEDFSL